jgi:hypothetical protein
MRVALLNDDDLPVLFFSFLDESKRRRRKRSLHIARQLESRVVFSLFFYFIFFLLSFLDDVNR